MALVLDSGNSEVATADVENSIVPAAMALGTTDLKDTRLDVVPPLDQVSGGALWTAERVVD